ncbi:MAG: PCRF domain-containing protein, partial [Duncaniella sp.]|nr:PCRF domain-containing protein [Duncaniella sp.]
MADHSLLDRLDGIEARFDEVSTLITDPSLIQDMKRYVRLTKEYKDLERLVGVTRRYRTMLQNIDEAREVLDQESDPELRDMAKDELDEATTVLPALEEEIKLLLIPADPE